MDLHDISVGSDSSGGGLITIILRAPKDVGLSLVITFYVINPKAILQFLLFKYIFIYFLLFIEFYFV